MPEFIEIDLNKLINNGQFPCPTDYQYYKSLLNNTIILNGEIDDSLLEYVYLPLQQMDNDPEVKEITLILQSIGGEIYSGFSLVSLIESLHTNITIKIIGMAASMAGLIAMAKGDHIRVVCDKWSVGLIHSGSQYMEGTTHAVRDTFKFSERYEEKIKQYILSHTKITEDMYNEIERQEFWMDAEDMLKYGIVDEIV